MEGGECRVKGGGVVSGRRGRRVWKEGMWIVEVGGMESERRGSGVWKEGGWRGS